MTIIKHTKYKIKKIFLFISIILPLATAYAESTNINYKLIPRSYPEKCKYYLVKSETKNGTLKVIQKQVCPKTKFYSGISFSLVEIDCKHKKYKDIGYGEDDISNINIYPSSKWISLIKGSSKSDLVNFICK